jgi:hypothetical protein
MSQLGVFRAEDGALHVAPILEDGRLVVRHSLHEFCPCGPKLDAEVRFDIWIHQDRERGGSN